MVRAERGVRVRAEMALGGSESDLENRLAHLLSETGG